MNRRFLMTLLSMVIPLVWAATAADADETYLKISPPPPTSVSGDVTMHKEELSNRSVSTSLAYSTRAEAASINRKLGMDIGKVEYGIGPAGRNAWQGRTAGGDVADFAESLLLEAEKLFRLYKQNSVAEGAADYAAPLLKDARRLHQLTSSFTRTRGTAPAAKVEGEMKMLLGRLRQRVAAHDRWLQGGAAQNPAAGQYKGEKPAPSGIKQMPAPGSLKQRPSQQTAPASPAWR